VTDNLNITVPQSANAPAGARNLVMLVLDSLRYDSLIEAKPKNLPRLGEVQKRYSYATWTAPGHYNLLMGLVPHPERIPGGVASPGYLSGEFNRLMNLLEIDSGDVEQDQGTAHFLPTYLRTLGYHTRAMVSMPVLNGRTIANRDFESYDRMKRINDLASMIPALEFDPERPTFYLLNTGETHYPYMVPGDDPSNWPRISGVHGVVKSLAEESDEKPQEFSDKEIKEMRQRQVRAVDYVDGLLDTLFNALPSDTYLLVTADHGELFGEEGHFGHGPFIHQKVLEVPLAEGFVPRRLPLVVVVRRLARTPNHHGGVKTFV
jgi:hypothetical protein